MYSASMSRLKIVDLNAFDAKLSSSIWSQSAWLRKEDQSCLILRNPSIKRVVFCVSYCHHPSYRSCVTDAFRRLK